MKIIPNNSEMLEMGAVVDMRNDSILARVDYESISIEPHNDSNDFWDFDLSAFLLDATGKLPTNQHFVFYNNRHSPDRSVEWYDDGNDPGSTGEMTFGIDLARVDLSILQIVLIFTIHDAKQKNQTFRNVIHPRIRICANSSEQFRFEPKEIATAHSVEMCRLLRNGDGWVFLATGIGFPDTLQEWVQKFIQSEDTTFA